MDILLIITMQQSENTVSIRFFLFWIVSDNLCLSNCGVALTLQITYFFSKTELFLPLDLFQSIYMDK